jgi:hypothetical protein
LRPLIVFGVKEISSRLLEELGGALTLRYPRGRDNARQAGGAPTPFAESDQ